MKQQIITAAVATLLSTTLIGCGTMSDTKAVAPSATQTVAAPAGPILNDAAKAALGQAQADIKKAKANRALWTTADAAMKKAEEAAKAGDSETVIKQAAVVSDHVKMGLAQNDYPLTELK